ncbi:hypothetical protein ROLI_018660 [Roseobacter fucihabitans]|uniref:Uncharacterized protein n=1 Tax=Roseobacter fucihabitans TaxID=1537242 RepID=A0ABZ2BRZ8_9RHOB|nr:hypothetical protein [Roseobacter litoralis]
MTPQHVVVKRTEVHRRTKGRQTKHTIVLTQTGSTLSRC